MSQIFKATTAGNLPPQVPTSFTADSGVATPVANNLDVIGGTVTTNDPDGIATLGAGDTLTIQLTNRLAGTATSALGVDADIITFGLTEGFVYRFEFRVAGRSTAGAFVGEGVGYSVFATARRTGGVAVIIGTPFTDVDEDTNLAGSTISIVASGTNIILRANGIGGETIDYSAVGTYVVV